MNIAAAGEFGVPVIFVSGDRAAVRETQALVPDLETVVVKEALFTHAAGIFEHAPVLSLSPTKSRDLIRAAARRAVERIADFPLPPKAPFAVTV